MRNIGLVFSGGGGKGAYQIGVWQALRELGIEKRVAAVSGTSVGALNAALFLKGDLELAMRLWDSISTDALLHVNAEFDDALFFNQGLEKLVRQALCVKDRAEPPLCYAACKRMRDGSIKYFELGGIWDSSYRRQILLASAAIPAVFPPVRIDGELYVDGGANGDNTPVFPLIQNQIPSVIVVHLSDEAPSCQERWPDTKIIDLYPSEDLGGFLSGTLDFDPETAVWRRNLGYRDGVTVLSGAAFLYERESRELPTHTDRQPRRNVRVRSAASSTVRKAEKEQVEMEKMKFEKQGIQDQYEARLEQLKQLAHSSQMTTRVLWDTTVAKYAKTMERVRMLMEQDELRGDLTPRLEKQMQAFLEKCSKPEFHIALVGAIKAGKSSLINAILGEELASTEVTPETASLTKFRGSSKTDCVSITFYSPEEWSVLWESASQMKESKFMEEYRDLHAEREKAEWIGHAPIYVECGTREELKEEIRKWSSSRSATHYFVKEVEVFLKDFALPEGVILVDTPGLNDAVEYRSDITKNYIDRANAVFVCVKADKLSGPELATIYGVFSNARYHPEKIYVIATQQDSLNSPVDDWRKQRAAWLGHLKEKACYGSRELAERNLLSTSGYFYTLLKNQDHLERQRQFQLFSTAYKMECEPGRIPERYDELLDFTGIEALRRRMDHEIVAQYQTLLREDIASSYDLLRENISDLVHRIRKRQEEVLAASAKDIAEIQAVEEENQKKLEEARRDQEELSELFEAVKKDAASRKEKITSAIRNLGGK